MPELLIELFCEEIPARMQARAAEDFLRLMAEACAAEGLQLEHAVAHHGPRRLCLVAQAPAATEAVREEKRGPRVDAPAKALEGFLAANAVALDMLERRDTGKGIYYFLDVARPGRAATEVIAAALPLVLRKLPWPKSMRWGGAADFTFARPLRRVLCLFDGAVVAVAGLPAGLVATDITEGHRFLAPAPIRVHHFSDYMRRLREACVVVDAAERRRLISEGAEAAAKDAGLALVPDEGLLDEVTGLVEWPCPLLGRIDAAFMDLPPEVLRTSMRVNQRYFATTFPDGRPAPHFVVIANVPGADGGAAIIAGNERVLRARFSDARFLFEQDKAVGLSRFRERLDQVVFHARLGTIGDKVRRLPRLAGWLGGEIIGEGRRGYPFQAHEFDQLRAIAAAAAYCKADLTTGMVKEFPELQGVMGFYYAHGQFFGPGSEHPSFAAALRDHYAPRGAGDPVPRDPVGGPVALADKLDTLVGFFAIDERPTGSGDPFALRRAALGIIRLVVENRLRFDLGAAVIHAFTLHREQQPAEAARVFGLAVASEMLADGFLPDPSSDVPHTTQAFAAGVLKFLADRLRVQLRAEGKRHDIVAAILARGTDPDLVRLLARANALEAMLATDDGRNLLAAYTRAANILRIEEKRDGSGFDGAVDETRLADPAERALHQALAAAATAIAEKLAAEDFAGAMAAMASLRHPLDTFFEQVTVNAPEKSLRENRLNLLSRLRAAFDQVADFSKIEG